MVASAPPPNLASLPTSDPRVSEEGRELMQARLALLGKVTFGLSTAFLIAGTIASFFLDGPAEMVAEMTSARRILNTLGAALSLSVWLVARRPQPLSAPKLLWLDVIATIAAVVPYTLMAVIGQPGYAAVLLTALTVMLVLQTRALMVPSNARRTLFISSAAAVLSVAVATGAFLLGYAPPTDAMRPRLFVELVMWLSVIVAASTIASSVLFGLRREVSEARRLGQYTLEEKIGEGGMGVVYRARHALLRRPTAVKLLPAGRAGDAAVRRFEREVQLTASLVHPNTVKVFDYGRTPDGVFYYAMEYLDGGDLEAVVQVGGAASPERTVHILSQVVAGLAEAHEIGLIHRDIKPANVLLMGSGPVADLAKVVDFGLVRELEPDEDDDASGSGSSHPILGTPLFLAPEAISAPETVDARADIYAVGAIGYYLLTAQRLFDATSIVEICSHQLYSRPVTPSERVSTRFPEALEELIMSCLEKDPAHRPQRADELRDLLETCEGVGVWSRRDAQTWWKDHGGRVSSRRARRVSATTRTIAVELAGRP